ncbi:TonB-dependent siderophore receptor [Cellvibrio mixtus]|uniref:TonB-dependent siderophore receptor n=1 Tax=Cellvibrio mixtus TaxID=39650 RepID=A0A266Q6T0_9GAMM|nr:TonB-dependent siderophore receptor [Cellvibrio mixtus]OZY85593.1 TonB-dependent siderophore receptor [Cellvibrio mixtus]
MFTQKSLVLMMASALCGASVSVSSLAADNNAASNTSPPVKTSRKAQNTATSVEEVTVTGSYTTRSMNGATGLDMTLRETPQTITIVTSQMIQDKGLVDMEQVLDHVPGVSKSGDASEYSLMYVRGFQLDTGVQVDGMITTPANSTYSGDASQSLDPVLAERIEILKGAAGILGGQGEPSATVNMIRKRPTTDFQASLTGAVGSWDTYRAEGDISGSISESGNVRGRLIGSYMEGDSYIDRYSRDKSVTYGIVDWDLTPQTLLSLAVDQSSVKSYGVYNWSSNPAFYTDGTLIDHDTSFSTGYEWAYRVIEQWSVMPYVKHEFTNGWVVKGTYRFASATQDVSNATYGAYVDKATGNVVDARVSPHALFSGRESDTTSFNIVTNGGFGLFGRDHEVVFGYSYSKNEFDLLFDYADLPTYNLNNPNPIAPDYSGESSPYDQSESLEIGEQSGAYTTLRFSLADPLKLMLGGRVSNWSYDNTNKLTSSIVHAEEKNVVTPYAGIVYDVNSFLSVYTSYTGIFKPVGDYGADGNLLEPTEGTNTEAGIKMAFFDNDLNISAAVYRANKDNVSEYANMGRLPNGNWIYRSVDGIKTDGYEIEIAGAISEQWNISGGYTDNKAEDKDGNPRQTYIPTKQFKITNSYSFVNGLTLGASARWQNYSYGDTTIPAAISATGQAIDVRQEQPSYWLVDVMARYELTDSLSVSLNVDNLFDETYNRSMWGYADFGEPRSATLSAKYTF